MHDFWIHHGFDFFTFGGLIIGVVYLSLFSYTGSAKKLDMVVNDIKDLGYVRQEVLDFDKSFNPGNFDPGGFSIFTHLFYRVPKEKDYPELYNNQDFIDQLGFISLYRTAYKIVLALIIFDAAFIGIMYTLYGPCNS